MMKIDINLIDEIKDESAYAEKCLKNADNGEAISYWQGYLQALAYAQILANKSLIDEGDDVPAKWLEKETFKAPRGFELPSAKCSNCGKYRTTPCLYYFNYYGYCPSCGKEMEK